MLYSYMLPTMHHLGIAIYTPYIKTTHKITPATLNSHAPNQPKERDTSII